MLIRYSQSCLTVLFLTVLLTICSSTIYGQQTSFGLKGGLNSANYYDSEFETERLQRFNFGVFATFELENLPISFQPELYYTQKGSKSSFQYRDIIYRGILKANYIEFPILANYTFGLFKKLNGTIFTGPSLSYLTGSSFESELGNSATDFKDLTNTIDYGIVFGFGVEFPLENNSVFVETRINRSFNTIYKNGYNAICCGEFARSQKHSVVSIVAGFGF